MKDAVVRARSPQGEAIAAGDVTSKTKDKTTEKGKKVDRSAFTTADLPPKVFRKDTIRVTVKEKTKSKPKHREGTTIVESGPVYYIDDEGYTDMIVIDEGTPHATEWHQYKLTLHFDTTATAETKVRLSVIGTRLDGNQVQETGPVYDPAFYGMFFGGLEQTMRTEAADGTGL